MTRFHWHIEQGLGAYIPQEGTSQHKDQNVQHIMCEIEMPGQETTALAMFTLPNTCLQEEGTKQIGIILAHGDNAEEWKGKLLTELSVILAEAGYVVMRYFCKQKEQRRYRVFEKALDACATSPYARYVTRWILGGIGSGARVAATVGSRCRGQICGFIYLSYPLNERIPSQKNSQSDNSIVPLSKLQQASLFVHTLFDELAPLEDLKKYCKDRSTADARLLLVRDVDNKFKDYQGSGPKREVLIRIGDAVVRFADALHDGSLDSCKLPKHDEVNAAALSESSISIDLMNHINNNLISNKSNKQELNNPHPPQNFSQTTAASLLYGQRYVPPPLPPTSMSLQSLLERPQVTTGNNLGQGLGYGLGQGSGLGQGQGQGWNQGQGFCLSQGQGYGLGQGSGLSQSQGQGQEWNQGQGLSQGQVQLSDALQSFGQYLNAQYGTQFQGGRSLRSQQYSSGVGLQQQSNQKTENKFAQFYQQWNVQQQQQQQLRQRYKELVEHQNKNKQHETGENK